MRILLRIILFLSITSVAFDATGGEAAHDSLTVEADTLPEVVVRGRQTTVIVPQRISEQQIENLNVRNVADAVRYFAGVQIKDYGGVGGVKTVDVRSMGSTHTGVFYDGIQLGNAQNGQIDLGKYSLDNIGEITLYNGQKSDIFQPARDFASASAIYIRTRTPRFSLGKRYNLDATIRSGSFGLINPAVRFDYALSANVSASVSAEYTRANGRYKFRYRKVFSDGTLAWDTTAVRRNGDIEAFRIEAGLNGAFTNGTWNARAYFYDSERGIPGAIVNNVWKTSQRQWDRNFFVQGRVMQTPTDSYQWMINAKYARDRMRYLNPDTTLLYIDNKFLQQEMYLSTTHKLVLLPFWEIALSADWTWNTLDASLQGFVHPVRNTLMASAATSVDIAGLRAQGALLLTYVNDCTDAGGSQSTKRKNSDLVRVSPSIYLSWTPEKFDRISLHGFAKKVMRMPTFNDLYYTDIGNASLRPENALMYDFGARYTITRLFRSFPSQLELTADFFHNRVTDKIIAVPKGTGQYRWMMMNIGNVRITGLDAVASLHLRLPKEIELTGRATYTFQRALDYSDPSDRFDEAATYKSQIAYIPVHSCSATADAEWRRLGLAYSFIYVGERYQNSSNIPVNYVQPWYTHDLALRYTVPAGRTGLRFCVEVNNLFNQQYEVIQNYPMPGRNFRISLNVQL